MSLTETPLSGLASVSAGGPAPQGPDAFGSTGHPFVRAGSLPMLLAGADESSLEHLDATAAKKHGLRLFPAGAVLFAKSGMSATKGLVYRLKQPAYVVSHLAALVPHDEHDGAFLARALQFFSPTRLIRDAAYPSIRLEDVGQMRIPVPVERGCRTRIAEILDQADALRGKRRAALALVDGLTQAIFLEMFGNSVANSRKWPDGTRLGDVAEIVSGVTKGRPLKGQSARAVPYLAVSNVQDRHLDLEVVKEIEATEDEIRLYRLRRNDLLLTEGGDPDKLGRGTLWAEELPECIHQNHIFRVRADDKVIRPVFLSWLVGSARGKKYFLRSAKQTTGIASINMTQLRGFPLLLPPMALQNAFASRAAAVDKLKAAHRASLTQIDALFASLQHRAFRGEL